ncbi:flagellin N-terminal helical domain-containing protein [Tepidimicrobium xylanilyticum]|uniref:Flagellin n=1 Tax=Tepidimicrobium xylanilyticum TaxID=1123352 RepID=A0A1H3C8M1_9FIRM|nr:flagellin [Tepidimicrobium xylanilyticum]GMG97987.1 flagellin [Tepidimicrobium xylanilyticum]SDX50497.1 flagellin [Tepidimicrobium xylanilyticum]
MRINNNIPALNTHRMLGLTNSSLEKTLERLSSGRRINRASDDAAGLAISQKMEAQVRGLRQASRNSLDGISLIQTAEGALNEVHAMLQRMRELAVQGANQVYEKDDLKAIADELKELTEQIDKIARETTFNGIFLLKGELYSGDTEGKLRLQIGANEDQYIDVDMKNINITVSEDDEGLKIINEIIVRDGSGFKVVDGEQLDSSKFSKAITIYDNAVKLVASYRSQLGAYQNRLEHTIKNVDNTAENLTAAQSRIEDADMALEMSEFVKLNILQQAGVAMLSQANQLPKTMLQLLQ